LGNILDARANIVDQLNALIIQSAYQMLDGTYALMIVDSIMAPFRVNFSGRGELAERQLRGKTLNRLIKLSTGAIQHCNLLDKSSD